MPYKIPKEKDDPQFKRIENLLRRGYTLSGAAKRSGIAYSKVRSVKAAMESGKYFNVHQRENWLV